MSYAKFEGVIPQGEYGAGAVIVWDRGTWVSLPDDPARALEGAECWTEKARKALRLIEMQRSSGEVAGAKETG